MHSQSGVRPCSHVRARSSGLLRKTASAGEDLTDKSDMAMAELRKAKEEVNEKMKAKQRNCSHLVHWPCDRAGLGRCEAKVR